MKFISWNVNGLRAVMNKNFREIFESLDADIFCLQEIKCTREQADFEPEGYYSYYNSSTAKKGYSGTAVFTKNKPLSVKYGIDGKHTDEGRVITCEYENFYFVCCYVPNAQPELKRIDYRMNFEDDMREYLTELDKKKPVVYCGDLNVAHNEIDLKNPKTNVGHPGFSDEERGKFNQLLNAGFADTFRRLYPDKVRYSWWSYRFRAREKNSGWRIDYFIVSERFMNSVKDSIIHTDIMGSDHCPVCLVTKQELIV
ncbi:MAG: exodeoxyribonuclease III [Ruminococcus sp.]|nr:exodeoxyribonuclease III [Ruminococcus sp.]